MINWTLLINISYVLDPSKSLKNMRLPSKVVAISEDLFLNSSYNIPHEIVISTAACGGLYRLEELSVMIKSALIFSQSRPVKFLIFTDNLSSDVEKLLTDWKPYSKHGLSWDIRPPSFPSLSKVKYACMYFYGSHRNDKLSFITFFQFIVYRQ